MLNCSRKKVYTHLVDFKVRYHHKQIHRVAFFGTFRYEQMVWPPASVKMIRPIVDHSTIFHVISFHVVNEFFEGNSDRRQIGLSGDEVFALMYLNNSDEVANV